MNQKMITGAGVLMCLTGLVGITSGAMAQEKQAALEGDSAQAVSTQTAAPASVSDMDALIAVADPEEGKRLARACGTCHSFTEGAGHKVGPNLHGVAGRLVASAPGYPYSAAFTERVGQIWTDAYLDDFLASPKDWAPGTRMSFPGLPDQRDRAAVIAYLRSLPEGPAAQDAQAVSPETADAAESPDATVTDQNQRLVREGLVVDFSISSVAADAIQGAALLQGDDAEVTFRITDQTTGEPVPGLFPGAWMDVAKTWGSDEELSISCKERVGLYLQGSVGIDPLIDLNSYYLLVMNLDGSILVFDPLVNIAGSTMLYAQINLKRPGADWAKTSDDKLFFVSMPRANQVAVLDTDVFKIQANLDAGVHPVRVALQPDEKYLWVGNDSKEPAESGVTVIDIATSRTVAQIPTGAGHHEIAFSDDSHYAFVSNRKSGTVTVIDVQKLEKLADIETGPLPISMAFSSLSKSLYVADGTEGVISVIDPRSRTVTTRINAMPGLGSLRFEENGRWGFVVNAEQDAVHVIDASADRIAQEIQVGTQPYQVAFSRSFAYVRSLATERVSMINLDELDKGRKPPVVSFPAGEKAPKEAPELNLADVIVEAPGEAAVLVVSPGDSTVYYYMEGMNAPMGAFRNYGHRPLAVDVADRALREEEPGVYGATVRLPHPGTYEVALVMDSPQILHCFRVEARPNPKILVEYKPLAVEYLVESRIVPAGESMVLRFLLTDPANGQLRRGLKDVRVLFYRAPVFDRTEVLATEVSDGLYEASLPLRRVGAYFVYVSSPSQKVPYGDLPFLTLRALEQKQKSGATQTKGTKG